MKKVMTVSITEYLKRKNVDYHEANGELITKCIFNQCDKDSSDNEAHLYFNAETSQYHCKKCDVSGNIFTLVKHFGDSVDSIKLHPRKHKGEGTNELDALAEKWHANLSPEIRGYLNNRGIPDHVIDKEQLGFCLMYNTAWISIPVRNEEGKLVYFKLRRNPMLENEKNNKKKSKMIFYPDKVETILYGLDSISCDSKQVVVCEGEFDCLLMHSLDIPAATSTTGAGGFKDSWLKYFTRFENIYVCLDSDDKGKEASKKLISKLKNKCPEAKVYQIQFPERMTEGNDITDYFVKYGGTKDEFLNVLPKQMAGSTPIDVKQFEVMSLDQLNKILDLTIMCDVENRLITFLCMLSMYTEDSQFNISFNAPSSTGKSYIPSEIARLFPEKDVLVLGYCSPMAFYHDASNYDKENQTYYMDLSRKTLLFLDQPHTQLLERLRPLLSHDKKEIESKITDKNQKSGLRAKKVVIIGYPSVVFCSANYNVDEQEGTRFIQLSPETTQKKIEGAIDLRILRGADSKKYGKRMESIPARKLLIERVRAIKMEKIQDVIIPDIALLKSEFKKNKSRYQPKDQRDIARLISLVKSCALLNCWFRKREDEDIIATIDDIHEAMKIWSKLSESQQYNIPPYVHNIYKEVILPAYREKNSESQSDMGLTRKEITTKYYEVYGRLLADIHLRQHIIPILETAGLVIQEPMEHDRRLKLVIPLVLEAK